jgi:hypothetical protein
MLDLSGLDIWASKGAAFGLPLLYMPPQESPEGVVVELNSLAGHGPSLPGIVGFGRRPLAMIEAGR